jgi:tetratricopeptide (TPR) repeat protein
MAGLMVNQGKAPEAIAVYQQAIRKIPKDAEAYYNLGVTWYNQGDYKKANGALKAARDRYRKQGNIEQASKVEQLMQQIVQLAAYKKTQVGQTQNTSPTPTSTSSVATPEPQTADPGVFLPVEQPTFGQ